MALRVAEILALGREGWRPYGAEPQAFVYERLRCTRHMLKNGRPNWLYRGDTFLCVGCEARCLLARPEGFSAPLPLRYPEPEQSYTLTPLEMATKKHVLTPMEAAYCLNVTRDRIYKWIKTGILVVLKEKPLRVRSSDVLALMGDFDE